MHIIPLYARDAHNILTWESSCVQLGREWPAVPRPPTVFQAFVVRPSAAQCAQPHKRPAHCSSDFPVLYASHRTLTDYLSLSLPPHSFIHLQCVSSPPFPLSLSSPASLPRRPLLPRPLSSVVIPAARSRLSSRTCRLSSGPHAASSVRCGKSN